MKLKFKTTIKFKSVLEGYKSISQRNKHFEELTDEGKRLEIAWDALKLVQSGLIRPSSGWYWSPSLKEVEGDSKYLQKVFNAESFFKKKNSEYGRECEVCARGAMMLCQIRLGNSIDSLDRDRVAGNESNIKGFSFDSFQSMEAEYENSAFKHPYWSNTDRKLANICCNVLVNGDFNPEDKTDYLIHK